MQAAAPVGMPVLAPCRAQKQWQVQGREAQGGVCLGQMPAACPAGAHSDVKLPASCPAVPQGPAAPHTASLLLLQGDGPILATDTATPSPSKGRQSTGDITKSTRQLLVKAQDQLRREQDRGNQPGPRTGV